MDIIFDIDGTVADASHRLPYITNPEEPKNWDAFFRATFEDKPILPMIQLIKDLKSQGNRILFMTGRPEKTRAATHRWFAQHLGDNVPYLLFTRLSGDRRSSAEVKRDQLHAARGVAFDPKIVFEDRKEDTKMWREEGLICCQVAEGDF